MDAQLLRKQIISHDWFSRRTAEYYRWYPKSLREVGLSVHEKLNTAETEGVYLHIPFCDEICRFCPFNKQTTSMELLDHYVAALIQQIRSLKGRATPEGLSFIYFGGGTPSVLKAEQIRQIIDAIVKVCSIGSNIEITLEAHPRNCADMYLSQIRHAGVNRISSGIQSFSDQILSRIHATHTSSLSHIAVRTMPKYFDNWGVDLLYRCPGQTIHAWKADLRVLLEADPPAHISCYTLSLPDDSEQPNAETDVDQAMVAQSQLEAVGYTHYASCATGGFDYAKPGSDCVYEKRHWGAPQASYVALGSGAIGFLSGMTTVNYHDTSRYIQAAQNGEPTVFLSSAPNVNELKRRFMVLGVKVLEVNLSDYERVFGTSPHKDFRDEFKSLIENGMIQIDETTLKLTNLGRYFVDQISERFWSAQEQNTPHPETYALRAVEQKSKPRD